MASKLRRWLKEGVMLALLLVLVMLVMDWWRAPKSPPAFDSVPLYTLDGQTFTAGELSADRPLLLYFWASWCGVCRFTTPKVAQLVAEGENVMTVALRSGDAQEVRRWLARKGVALPVVNDADGSLSRSWQVTVTPTLVVLDKGQVVSTTSGWTSYWGMKLRLWWASW